MPILLPAVITTVTAAEALKVAVGVGQGIVTLHNLHHAAKETTEVRHGKTKANAGQGEAEETAAEGDGEKAAG